MILVDTSVWIDFFRASPGPAGMELRRMIQVTEPLALSGIIVAEILQGLRSDVARIERFLGLWDILEPNALSTYRQAAAISRLARSKGLTLTTIDSLIASVAIENHARVFTLDKDFSRLARITSLQLHVPSS
jgi:predicted nucleic acid-binding protein